MPGANGEGYEPLLAKEEGDAATEDVELSIDHALLNTDPHAGLTTAEAHRRLAEFGRNELEERTKSKWTILMGHFTGPMPCMIWVAILIEALIQDWPNFGVLFFLQLVNGLVGFHEDSKAGDAVAALKASLKPVAQVKRDGNWDKINAGELVPGDIVALNAGSTIPADSKLLEGAPIEVDQSSLNGESLPATFYTNMVAKMGTTVVRGEIEAVVAGTGKNTEFGKTAALIASVDEMPHFQIVLLRITKFLLLVSMVLVTVCFIYLLQQHQDVLQALAFCVVLLVASIPIAMQVVCTTTMALGSRRLADQKAIVARLSSIEELASMNMLCSDKTGTLTLNKMVLQEVFSYVDDETTHGVLTLAALAAKWKEPAKDALDTLVLNAMDLAPLDAYEQLEYAPFDPSKKRTEATLKGPDGRVFKVMKGAPNVVLGLCDNKQDIQVEFDAQVDAFAQRGIRCLAIAREYEGEGNIMTGLLTFLDPPRPDTKRTIERAKEHGVGVKMITGDHAAIAKETCRTLNMGDNILPPDTLPSFDVSADIPTDLGDKYGESIENCNGFAQVYPEHKFMIVEALRQRGWKCGMTGDGVNDAPALKKADVGIAVQGATDAARAASDLILTEEGLSVIVDAITISRAIFQRMKNYVIYRVACTIQLLTFFFCAVLFFHPRSYYNPEGANHEDRPDFFNLPVVALVVITILNDGTIISIAYDHVIPGTRPERWNLPVLYGVATWLGLVAVASSLLLLHWGLGSHSENSFWQHVLGFPHGLHYKEVMMMLYLKISLSDFFTVFAARTQKGWWTRAPGVLLAGAAILATASSTALALRWPFGEMVSLKPGIAFVVWVYCIIWFVIQDSLKVALYKALYHFDVDGIRTESEACAALAAENSVDARLGRLELGLLELKSLFGATQQQAQELAGKPISGR